jgi:hypothetical protein
MKSRITGVEWCAKMTRNRPRCSAVWRIGARACRSFSVAGTQSQDARNALVRETGVVKV